MPLPDPETARWLSVPPGRGHYESYYLRAVHPTEPRGVWIRYTMSIAPGGPPTGQLWCTVFDRTGSGPRAVRAVRVDVGEVAVGDGAWLRLGTDLFGPSGIDGAARSPEHAMTWSLRERSGEAPLLHLPRSWMYRARLPRTKLLSLRPATVFDGALDVDGEHIDVEGWPGMVGHNWGEQHARTWIWLHGLGFAGAGPDTWLDLAVARVGLGPVTTPWVANGVLSLDGVRHRLGGLGRRIAVTPSATGCELRVPGAGPTVTVHASAPAEAFVEWDYADPDGTPRRVLNCSVADLRVGVERPDAAPLELIADGRGAYEFGRSTQA